MKWLLSLTRSVVHKTFHQQGFDQRDLMIWIGLRLWEVVDYGRWSLTRSPHVIKAPCNPDPRNENPGTFTLWNSLTWALE